MRTSETIAALIGPTLIASAISIFINLSVWPAMVDQVFQNAGVVFLSAYPLFVAGLATVYFYNQWSGGWPVLVTALGWLALLGGLSRILFPSHLAGIAARAVRTAGVMLVAAVVIFLGAFLSFEAYPSRMRHELLSESHHFRSAAVESRAPFGGSRPNCGSSRCRNAFLKAATAAAFRRSGSE